MHHFLYADRVFLGYAIGFANDRWSTNATSASLLSSVSEPGHGFVNFQTSFGLRLRSASQPHKMNLPLVAAYHSGVVVDNIRRST